MFKNGLIVPNNVTTYGIQSILAMALQNTDLNLWVGLCSAVYEPDLQIEDVVEPTIGVNGYVRKAIMRDNTGWPTAGLVNLQPYLETDDLIWEPSGEFDQSFSRMFICTHETNTTGNIFAISGSLNEEVVWDETTLEADRTLKYRIYSR